MFGGHLDRDLPTVLIFGNIGFLFLTNEIERRLGGAWRTGK